MTTYFRRDISAAVRRALEEMPVVAVTGMRQTGKSTFLQKEPGLQKRRYVTFDDLAQLAAAKEAPDRFLLSGSANFAMLRSITESLAGRAIYYTMHPFTRRERAGEIALPSYVERLLESGRPPKAMHRPAVTDEEVLSGGMPSVCLGEVGDRALWFKAYEQTYLERDIRQFSRLDNIILFKNLIGLAALRDR